MIKSDGDFPITIDTRPLYAFLLARGNGTNFRPLFHFPCSTPQHPIQHPSEVLRQALADGRLSKLVPTEVRCFLHSSSYVKDMLKKRIAAEANVLIFGQTRVSVQRIVTIDESGQQQASNKKQVDNFILHTAHCGCEKSQHTVVGATARVRLRPAREPGERPGRYPPL